MELPITTRMMLHQSPPSLLRILEKSIVNAAHLFPSSIKTWVLCLWDDRLGVPHSLPTNCRMLAIWNLQWAWMECVKSVLLYGNHKSDTSVSVFHYQNFYCYFITTIASGHWEQLIQLIFENTEDMGGCPAQHPSSPLVWQPCCFLGGPRPPQFLWSKWAGSPDSPGRKVWSSLSQTLARNGFIYQVQWNSFWDFAL